MATDEYAAMYIFLDGQLLVEELTVEWDFDPKNNPVMTQAKGFAGITPGAGMVTINVTNAIPRAGTEVDYIALTKDRTPVEVQIQQGIKKLASKGFINKLKGKGGVNQDSTLDFEMICGEPEEMI